MDGLGIALVPQGLIERRLERRMYQLFRLSMKSMIGSIAGCISKASRPAVTRSTMFSQTERIQRSRTLSILAGSGSPPVAPSMLA
jgi:hypothetical protein